MSANETLERMIRRLATRAPLSDADCKAIRALPFISRTFDPANYLVREGEPPQICYLLVSGFAYRHKVTGDGERQIIAVHMASEFLDLQNSMLEVADHNVQALTRCDVMMIPVAALRTLAAARPAVAMAMWIETLVDAAVFREWIVNVGRRDALSRIGHLLCEFVLRLRAAGLADESGTYEFPMTQEQLADAVGLTPVHVNRVLKELGRLELISRDKRAVTILDWDRLRHVGDFSSRYLHMGDGAPYAPQVPDRVA